MIKRYIFVLFMIIFSVHELKAQDFSALWNSHFSYFNIIDITRSDSKIYAAAENVVFSYDVNSNEIKTITTVDGLSGNLISTIEYSQDNQLLLIGYKTGLIEIYFESDQSIRTIVDILEKRSIDPTIKTINDFYEYQGFAYIATDFGISVYDLERLEFGDTYFIGNNNSQIPVEKTTIFNDAIYAACNLGYGIKKGSLFNPNLIDSGAWQTITTGSFISIEALDNKVYALNINRDLSEINNDNLSAVLTFTNLPLDSNVTDNQLVYTTNSTVFIYDSFANLISEVNQTADFQTKFTSAITFGQDMYVSTNSFGVLKTPKSSNSQSFQPIRPDGPLLNNPFKVQAFRGGVWVTFGEYTSRFNPDPPNSRGISVFDEAEWLNIPFEDVLGSRELNAISINPFDTNQVFISSFFDGILELNERVPNKLFDTINTTLQRLKDPLAPDRADIRVGASKFDTEGKLWSITSRVDDALNSYNPSNGQWQPYSFESIIVDANSELGFADLEIDNRTGTKWIASTFNGLIGYNENLSNRIKKIDSEESGLPINSVSALAVDNSGQLWIGTNSGLRVLFNPSDFFKNDNVQVESIIFIEDGLARELLESQSITDIEVDGANNKWISTLDSGVFYFTPNGQSTIYHFTKDNSPLPTNVVNDISIDQSNGTVYFATPNGLVSFRAGGSSPVEALNGAYVYPNPVRPDYNILGSNDLNDINKGVKIVGLTENVNVKITDIEGNLVTEAQSRVNRRNSNIRNNFAIDGGTGIWNGKNLANSIVASGVYLIIISDLDTFESKILKLLIIR